jgi:hypothetical protein
MAQKPPVASPCSPGQGGMGLKLSGPPLKSAFLLAHASHCLSSALTRISHATEVKPSSQHGCHLVDTQVSHFTMNLSYHMNPVIGLRGQFSLHILRSLLQECAISEFIYGGSLGYLFSSPSFCHRFAWP